MEDNEIVYFVFKRGDSFRFKTRLRLKSGEGIKKEDIKELYVTVREGFDDVFPIIFKKTIDDVEIADSYAHIIFNPEDTENLNYGTYAFDLEVTLNTTPVIRKTKSGKFTLSKETTIHKKESVEE